MLYTREDAERYAGRAISAVTVAGSFAVATVVIGLFLELTDVVRFGDGWVGLGFALIDITAWLALLVSGIRWVQWFQQVYANVDHRGRGRHGVVTAVWAWFVPLIGLVLPKRMVNDVWRVGMPRNARPSPPVVVQAWWACWVVYSGLDLVRLWRDDLREDVWNAVVTGRQALLAVTAVLAVRTIRVLTARVMEPVEPLPAVEAYAG